MMLNVARWAVEINTAFLLPQWENKNNLCHNWESYQQPLFLYSDAVLLHHSRQQINKYQFIVYSTFLIHFHNINKNVYFRMPIQAPQWTDYLNCPVCCREFGPPPRSPISLGCGHTLCGHCLKHLHRKQCPFDQVTFIYFLMVTIFLYFVLLTFTWFNWCQVFKF